MSVTKERFEQGLTYAEYRAQMTRNQERFIANESAVALDANDLAFFATLAQPVYLLALAEDWCGDVINNLPVVGRLAEAGGKVEVRVFLRDQNLDIMDQYLKEGQFRSIPVFVLFDADFQELGHWIERPARITELQEEMRQQLWATDPLLKEVAPDTPFGQLSEEARNRVMAAYATFRQEYRAFSDAEVVRELRAIVEHGTSQAAERKAVTLTLAQGSNGTSTTRRSQAKISITYCAACGYEPQTLELTGALMRTFVNDIAAIELIPWHDGAFDVVVNGDLVHSMYRDGGFPENATIVQAVRDRLA
ncbi:MAG: SelT/SelW/SelH family protein [Caldilineaceae bacterium]|nr:SelT/SelW/SelH family protein [Caldilineaceae bacterium]